ncbi:MAG: phage N-6-adenine-methyltransferase, partial [Tannerella sp.]|nr:phage N-6-adenine-methyltransferase [Tannerella sp.]
MHPVIYSSQSELWATPQAFFDELNGEFHFTLDACALPENAKCKLYFTPERDGLVQDWSNHAVFCNPPYEKKISLWVEKCYRESCKENTKVVMLIPARTDTLYFHRFIYKKA